MSRTAPGCTILFLALVTYLGGCSRDGSSPVRSDGPVATEAGLRDDSSVDPSSDRHVSATPVVYDEQGVRGTFLRTAKRQDDYQTYAACQLSSLTGELDPQQSVGYADMSNSRGVTSQYSGARARQMEAYMYEMDRRTSSLGNQPAPPQSIVRRVLPLLCAAADVRDDRAALDAVSLASGMTDNLREQQFDAPILAICERWGEVNVFVERHYSSPYLNFRGWLYRLKRNGDVSGLAGDLNFTVINDKPSSSGLMDAAAGELFHYVGNYDLALAFYWTALKKTEAQAATGGQGIWLVLDASQQLHALFWPRQLYAHSKLTSLTEELPDCSFVRRVPANRQAAWEDWIGSGEMAKDVKLFSGFRRNSLEVRSDLQRGMVLVGLADCFLGLGRRQWAAQLAEAAIQACDIEDARSVQSGMLSSGGEHGFPSDFYTVPARALRILGEVDLEHLMQVAGSEFPERSQLGASHQVVAQRARRRLKEAYQLYIGGRHWADAYNTAYQLVRLETLERTAGGATGETLTDLRKMLGVEGMMIDLPKRWCTDVEPPESCPLDLTRVLDLQFFEKRGTLAATLAALAGDKDAARKESQQCSVWWSRVRARMGGESIRLSMAHSQNRRHERLIRSLHRVGLDDDALLWTERVRNRALLDIIGQGRARENHASTKRAEAMFQLANQRFAELQQILPIELTMELRLPGSTTMEGADFVDVPELSDFLATLPKQTALIDYYLFDESGIAWVLSQDGLQTVSLDIGKRKCRELVRRWRTGLGTETTRGVAGIVDIQQRDVVQPHTDSTTRELYDALVAPVAKHASEQRHWCIIPHGPLKYLSFAALSDGHHLCLDRHAISYLWSLNVLPRLVALDRPRHLERIACLGNPDTGVPQHALPGTETEVREVAKLFADSSLFLGKDASYYHLAVSARDADVLHLACHALPVDRLGNRALFLAPTDRHSGHVAYDALYRLQTPAFLATLSCCSTGLGQEMAGDELLGFSRGFLAAGVPSLVISLWDVPDQATAELTAEFYRQLRDHDLATALQKAQQKVAASCPAPWYWGAFTVYGVWDPVGSQPDDSADSS